MQAVEIEPVEQAIPVEPHKLRQMRNEGCIRGIAV